MLHTLMHKLIRFAIFKSILGCLLGCFFASGSSMSFAADGVATVLAFEGDVAHLDQENIEKIIRVGSTIEARHSLATAGNGRVLFKLPDGSKLWLEPDSELMIESLINKTDRGYQGASRLILNKGGILADVTKRFVDHVSLEINTDQEISFWVKGTYFYIFIDASSSHIWALVKGGTVQAVDFQHDDYQLIGQGESMVALQGKYLTKSAQYEWAKKLGWKGAIETNSLFKKRVQLTHMRDMEIERQVAQLRNRKTMPFIDDISKKYNTEGLEQRQYGEAILSEVKSSGRESESADAFDDGNNLPTPAIAASPTPLADKLAQANGPASSLTSNTINNTSAKKTEVAVEAAKESEESIKRKEELAKFRANNVCRWANIQGFSCSTAKQCPIDMPYTIGDSGIAEGLKVCLGCKIASVGNDCIIKPQKCSTYSDVYLESGFLFFRGNMAYRCIDLLPFNITKLKGTI